MNNEEIEKIFKPKNKLLLIALLMIITSFVLFYISDSIGPKEVVAKNYHDLISIDKDEENSYVEVTFVYMASFAEVKDYNLKYYYIQDEDGYIYIARITDETFNNIVKMAEDADGKFTYTLKGYLFDIPEDAEDLAITGFDDVFNEDVINKDNYEDYFGDTFLDETKTPSTFLESMLVGIGILLDIFSFVVIIMYIIDVISLKVCMGKINVEELKNELYSSNSFDYKKENVYLTKNYIISRINVLKVTKYDDIVWIYIFEQKQNGITHTVSIIGKLNNKKSVTLASTFRNKDKLNDIMNEIVSKNKKILVGYTKENIEAFKNNI